MSEQNQYGQGRDLADRILERVASDPQFREELLRDPGRAMGIAGFTQEIAELQPPVGEEVQVRCDVTCDWTCSGFTCIITWW